jgi:hypothetical protein
MALLPIVGAVAGIGSSILGGIGSSKQSKAAAKQAKYQAEQNRIMASMILENAKENQNIIQTNTDYQLGQLNRQYNSYLGTARASLAGNGISLASGTANDIQNSASSELLREEDILKWNAQAEMDNMMREANLKIQQLNTQANLYDMSADTINSNSYLNLFGSILGGVSSGLNLYGLLNSGNSNIEKKQNDYS